MSEKTRARAGAVNDNPVVESGARLGYVASGVLHLLIAWVALQLAWSGGGGEADQSGALERLAGTGLGAAPLWVAVVGFALLGLWLLLEAVARRRAGDRLRSAAKGVVYLALCWTTVAVARGSATSSSEQTSDATARLMAQPLGRALVVAVGAVVVVVGGYHVVKGWSARFLADLRRHPGPWVVRAGRAGYVAKGCALVVVGGLFVVAGVRSRPDEATGLDGALRTMLDAPFGRVLLTVVALGLAAYGVYSLARARYARV
ncbi:DUF1206 domain-containing protein [Cellulomonas hominis]